MKHTLSRQVCCEISIQLSGRSYKLIGLEPPLLPSYYGVDGNLQNEVIVESLYDTLSRQRYSINMQRHINTKLRQASDLITELLWNYLQAKVMK